MEVVLALAFVFISGMYGPTWLKFHASLLLFITGLYAVCDILTDKKDFASDWTYKNEEGAARWFGVVFWGTVAYGGVALNLNRTIQLFYLGMATLLFFCYWGSLLLEERKTTCWKDAQCFKN